MADPWGGSARGSIIAGLLSLLAICGGAVLGIWLAPKLPEHHLTGETGTAVSVSMAVVGTLAALVLGFMGEQRQLVIQRRHGRHRGTGRRHHQA